ncbi:MAG: radical SAM protein [Candidatus Omnitrophota bacterium]|jgi:radical SAM protein with 4Fe4S-binding SPASM domain
MAIKTQEYKDFSWNLHAEAGHKPIVAQIELTHKCPLHCEHCYTDCYNNGISASRDLSTNQVEKIMDKCKSGGVVWLCFTGGDPMMRKDFDELYLYAKKLGFITTIFSPLVSMNKPTLEIFKSSPPFSIETTLNAATREKYKEITGMNLFEKHIHNIKKLLENGIPVKVKIQVTKQNISQIDEIKKLVESLGLAFRPSTMIFARLNGDTHPCTLRLDPKKAVFVNKQYGYFNDEESTRPGGKIDIAKPIRKPRNDKLLLCKAGGASFWITPQGEMIICGYLRTFNYNLLQKSHTVKDGFYKLNKKVHGLSFKTESTCRSCEDRMICQWCPGIAILEKGCLEEPIDYFCNLTKETIKASRG